MEYNVVVIFSVLFGTLIGFGSGAYGVYSHYQKAKTKAEKIFILALGGATFLFIGLTLSMSFFVSAYFAGFIVCIVAPALMFLFKKKYQQVCEAVV